MERRFLSVEEVAASLSVHQNTVRRWVREGALPAYKFGRQYRLDADELAEFLKSHRN